jgi:hypothetical protein
MDTTEQLLAAWRTAEAAAESAEAGTSAARIARIRADLAKTAYLARIDDIFDVEGHRATERPDPEPPPD